MAGNSALLYEERHVPKNQSGRECDVLSFDLNFFFISAPTEIRLSYPTAAHFYYKSLPSLQFYIMPSYLDIDYIR